MNFTHSDWYKAAQSLASIAGTVLLILALQQALAGADAMLFVCAGAVLTNFANYRSHRT